MKYLYTVRYNPGQPVTLDYFAPVNIPPTDSRDAFRVADKLSRANTGKGVGAELAQTVEFLLLRLRMNTDMYPHVCILTADKNMDADKLTLILQCMERDGKLNDWLDNSKVVL